MNRPDRLPQAWVDAVLAKTDIVDVVGVHVSLRRAGKEYKACCPFPDHEEKTPSFTVNPAKQFYHCFGCGKHGNALRFLMQYARLSFREAVGELARRAGVSLPDATYPRSQAQALDCAAIKACHVLHAFFERCLIESPARLARLSPWGVDEALARHLGLGYAPARYRLPTAPLDALRQAGLVREDGTPPFADRLVLPMRARRGAILGLIAFSLPDRLPEPLVLCGLAAAAEQLVVTSATTGRAREVFVVCEPADLLQLAALGLPVALVPGLYPLTTHFRRLESVAEHVVLCLPSGATGEAIALLCAHQYADAFRPDGGTVRVLFVPPGRSTGAAVREMERGALAHAVRDAPPLLDVALRALPVRLDRASRHDRQRYLGHIVRFAGGRNPAVAALAAHTLMNAWGLALTDIQTAIAGTRAGAGAVFAAPGSRPHTPAHRVLRALLHAPDVAQLLPETLLRADDPGIRLLRDVAAHLCTIATPSANDARSFIARHPQRDLLELLASGVPPTRSECLAEIVDAVETFRLEQARLPHAPPAAPHASTAIRPSTDASASTSAAVYRLG